MAKDCGHNIPCGCKDTPLTTPAPCGDGINCPDATPCSETFDAQCVYYTGEPIVCDRTTLVDTNTSLADAIINMINLFCDQTQIDADILCGTDVVVAAERTVENAIADVVSYFCEQLDNINLFTRTTVGVVGVPDGEGLPCTTYTHTITYLDSLGATIDTTVFTTRTCEEVDLCAGKTVPIDTTTNVVICDNGEQALTNIENIIALVPTQGLFTQTADKTVVNTITPTSLIGTGLGSLTVGINEFVVGDSFVGEMKGNINIGTPVDLTITLQINGVDEVVVGPIAMPNIGSLSVNKYFTIDTAFTIRSIGASGTVMSSINFSYEENASDKFNSHTEVNLATLNTTVLNTLDIKAEFNFADPSNLLTSQIFTLRKVY